MITRNTQLQALTSHDILRGSIFDLKLLLSRIQKLLFYHTVTNQPLATTTISPHGFLLFYFPCCLYCQFPVSCSFSWPPLHPSCLFGCLYFLLTLFHNHLATICSCSRCSCLHRNLIIVATTHFLFVLWKAKIIKIF